VVFSDSLKGQTGQPRKSRSFYGSHKRVHGQPAIQWVDFF